MRKCRRFPSTPPLATSLSPRPEPTLPTSLSPRPTLVPTLALVLALGAAGCRSPGSTAIPEARADESHRPGGTGVAVVELFTSEGCSSCPPADGVLADLARQGREGGLPVYAVAFHVDYWDGLGWPDRFASPEHTARQRAYSRAFGTPGLYTPQMVVDGSEAFVGSDRDHALDSVTRALARPATASVSLRARPSGPDAVAVDYDVKGAPAGAVLSIVVVDRSASVAVRAGENAGRTLHHTDTARALATIVLAHPSGTQVVSVPPDATREGVIAFVQEVTGEAGDRAGMPIVGAARVAIAP
jgi:hypothetical protein